MASFNARPIVFPLSNPVSLCEVDFEDAIKWSVYSSAAFNISNCFTRTNGEVIFASGSPYKPVEYEGKVFEPGQGNNMYMFPGIGMGAILAKARHVTDGMVEQAAIALSSALTLDEGAANLVYPRLARIRALSARIARTVIRTAQKEVGIILEV
jgi:malate dehydrogenase (oxaloacetate-decarboxylating)(NADP+)